MSESASRSLLFRPHMRRNDYDGSRFKQLLAKPYPSHNPANNDEHGAAATKPNSKLLGISTGGLIPRISFVAPDRAEQLERGSKN